MSTHRGLLPGRPDSTSTRSHDDYVIGVDIGTSSTKAHAYDLDGRVLASGRSSYRSMRGAGGEVRQRPSEWWQGTLAALRGAASAGARCRAIALSGQLGTYAALDKRYEPIEDAWTWQDGQPAAVLPQLAEALDLDRLASDLCTWLPPGPNWPLPRLLWLRQHRSDILRAAQALVMPKDYVLMRLTGSLVTDPSSWRGLVAPEGDIHRASLDRLDLPDLVPPRESSTACAGTIRREVADATGLPAGTPVYIGTGDYAAALLGTGVVSDGDGFDIGGTSEHLGILSSQCDTSTGQVVVPYLEAEEPGRFLNYGVSSNGGSVKEWLGEVLLPGRERSLRSAELAALAASAPRVRRPLFFVPYLAGERSPIWNADASGAWIGLRSEHTTSDLVKSAFEGVVFNLRHIRDMNPLMSEAALIRASGGTARSATWNQIKADVLGMPIATLSHDDAGALGAAMHGAAGVGLFESPAAAARAMTALDRVFEPDQASVALYEDAYHHYRALAGSVAALTHAGGDSK